MARDFATAFYKSAAWKQCREAFISARAGIDGGMCMRCHKAPGYIVHHKVYLDAVNIKDPYVSLNIDNLEYLCLSCHSEEHSGSHSRLRCAFDEKGRPIQSGSS